VRLAVFTNQFPSRPSTFFARDVRALIEAGVSVDIFPTYPLDAALWDAVPELLSERVFPRNRVHHLSIAECLRPPKRAELGRVARATRALAAIDLAALRYGPMPVLKSSYVAVKALGWARRFPAGSFDHVLAYWGNYSASCAYLYHLLTDATVPFSMLVHARMDLYEKPAYLAQKMLYADNVFLVCEYNRDYIRAHFPDAYPRLEKKIRIHHLGLDLRNVSSAPDPRPSGKVVAVGRFERLKGLHCLLDAVAALRAGGRRVEVELIGGGPEEARLRAQAEALGIAPQVTFRGWLNEEGVLEGMRRATVVVHPSIRPDAMPTVLKEAIAAGTPVIASDLAGIPEILDRGRCGMLVPAGDTASLAAAIGHLLADPALRTRLAVAGRQHAEDRFDMWRNGRLLADRLRATPRRRPV
jgi:glycosyltransferase involved in cell wall biosynthesis